jgi:N-methylhydantoinase A
VGKVWLGVDTGGSSTDLDMRNAETGEQWLHKSPTTMGNASRRSLKGVHEILNAAWPEADVDFVLP